jgi:hypothetical protein
MFEKKSAFSQNWGVANSPKAELDKLDPYSPQEPFPVPDQHILERWADTIDQAIFFIKPRSESKEANASMSELEQLRDEIYRYLR